MRCCGACQAWQHATQASKLINIRSRQLSRTCAAGGRDQWHELLPDRGIIPAVLQACDEHLPASQRPLLLPTSLQKVIEQHGCENGVWARATCRPPPITAAAQAPAAAACPLAPALGRRQGAAAAKAWRRAAVAETWRRAVTAERRRWATAAESWRRAAAAETGWRALATEWRRAATTHGWRAAAAHGRRRALCSQIVQGAGGLGCRLREALPQALYFGAEGPQEDAPPIHQLCRNGEAARGLHETWWFRECL